MPWTDEYFPRVKRPSRLPVVLSQEEVLLFFDHVTGLKYRAALMVCYGAGLRISETVALKVSDIDESRTLIASRWRDRQCGPGHGRPARRLPAFPLRRAGREPPCGRAGYKVLPARTRPEALSG
jgi:integrase